MTDNKITTVAIEDLAELAIKDAINCLHLALDDCNMIGSSEDKNNYNRLVLVSVFEKYLRQAFTLGEVEDE